MAFSLQPPPVDADVAELYQWCFRLWEWLQVPERPCFLVTNTSNQDNIAIDSWIEVAWDTESFDIDGNFASNTFTAPVTGKYFLVATVRLDDIDTGATYYQLRFNTSNSDYRPVMFAPNFSADVPYFSLSGSAVVDMDANDTVTVEVYQSGGTQQTDIDSHSNVFTSFFSGVLVAR